MLEPGGLLSIGSHRVGHNWSDLACMHALEKEMATHSCILAWRIPGTGEPGGLLSMGSHRVGHDWSDLAAAAASLSHSIIFLSFFALIFEEGFLISPCYSLELCIQWVCLSFSPLPFASLLFTAFCKASSESHFAFLHLFFLGMVFVPVSCTMSWTSIHSSSGTLSDLGP